MLLSFIQEFFLHVSRRKRVNLLMCIFFLLVFIPYRITLRLQKGRMLVVKGKKERDGCGRKEDGRLRT